jgi:hypothetical protein
MEVREQRLLAVIRDIFEVSALCSTRTYIWAGLVRDILSERFLRDHGDVDGFTLNLWQTKDELADRYRRRGYAVTFLADVQFMKIERDGLHAVFNRLEFDRDTAQWRHIGDEGTVYFPKCWLSDLPVPFYDTRAYVSGPEFEYGIKTNPHLLSPLWHGRDKDREAIDWLEQELDKRRINRAEILGQIWSYNPYWVKKGYADYSGPVRAGMP